MNRTIIIMAKVPRAGNVKTRLQPFLAAEQCATLAEAFLLDTIDKTRNLCDKLIIAFAPASEVDYFADLNIENLTLIEQHGADLGEKMFDAFSFAFCENSAANVVMIGTDSPTFPPEYIEKSFNLLESDAEMVLGKSADGGFYLIGLREIEPHLFGQIEWSSPQVFEQITRNIERLKIKLMTVGDWFDVDTPDDLRFLRDEMSKNSAAEKIAPQTFKWLIANDKIFG